ncbi:hypothetical protein BC829DRAFT_415141 [Chytridium lagenaria]|nr:hypothetical protein BC829DRAFT_415141 [Chytridium lagenaria]
MDVRDEAAVSSSWRNWEVDNEKMFAVSDFYQRDNGHRYRDEQSKSGWGDIVRGDLGDDLSGLAMAVAGVKGSFGWRGGGEDGGDGAVNGDGDSLCDCGGSGGMEEIGDGGDVGDIGIHGAFREPVAEILGSRRVG